MNETVVTVQGAFTAHFPPERATVRVEVSTDGPERGDVFSRATEAANSIRASVGELHNPATGPVTEWSSGSVSVFSERPWNNEGAQLPLVFHATIGFSVRFSDFAELARWIEVIAVIEGVVVESVVWSLTPGRETTVTAEVRSRAVKDAVAKATVFAQSIGLGTVRPIALADPGMLGDQGGGGQVPLLRASKATMASNSGLSLKPEDIEITAEVDARFMAS